MNVSTALLSLCPQAEFILENEDYSSIVWLNNRPEVEPSLEQLQSEIARLQADYDAKLYQRQRAQAYPPIQDLADAIYWQTQGNTEPMNAYIAACAQVKQQYPQG
ncbi:MAG: hypothetical protein EBT26_05285 [Microbacteriaceae bacterium]|nr:hypothetical protein [Microbacteriaceae bacterium]NBS61439.1 hypothetical protein [Microbacteriaceae bacterium]